MFENFTPDQLAEVRERLEFAKAALEWLLIAMAAGLCAVAGFAVYCWRTKP